MIEISRLSKSYGSQRALDGFDLRVEQGELFGLVGPNGAGKTTLIKTLATLIQPNAGSVRVAGIDVTREPRKVKGLIGYMPDQPGLYQDMRVEEFLTFFADAFHVPGDKQASAIENALTRAGLEARRQSFVEELSFGMKQRLQLAKSLIHEPQLLLLDEPATGLDPLARVDLRKQLVQLNTQGITMLISSHILSDLEEICTRVAFIAEGRNAADAAGHSVIEIQKRESPALAFEVGILEDVDAAAKFTGELAGVRVVSILSSGFVIEFTGDARQVPELLRSIVTGGFQVVKFDRATGALEDRYSQVFGAKSR
jgi:ABC-2 type transport system ATP-binding protein